MNMTESSAFSFLALPCSDCVFTFLRERLLSILGGESGSSLPYLTNLRASWRFVSLYVLESLFSVSLFLERLMEITFFCWFYTK